MRCARADVKLNTPRDWNPDLLNKICSGCSGNRIKFNSCRIKFSSKCGKSGGTTVAIPKIRWRPWRNIKTFIWLRLHPQHARRIGDGRCYAIHGGSNRRSGQTAGLGGSSGAVNQSTAGVIDGLQYSAFGHGTMTAGIVHLVAPNSLLMPLKSFNADGTGYVSDVLRAIYYSKSQCKSS